LRYWLTAAELFADCGDDDVWDCVGCCEGVPWDAVEDAGCCDDVDCGELPDPDEVGFAATGDGCGDDPELKANTATMAAARATATTPTMTIQ